MEGKGPARARAVVLYGFGGIGKTTLAKCVLPRLDLTNFKHCKVELDEQCSDLKVYQQQLCEGLTKEKWTFNSCADGQQKLKEVLEQESARYFIFIDNVLRNDQIDNLLPAKLSLPSSSMLRLLVTSRQLGTVTQELQVGRDVHCEKYHVEELPDDAAKHYFRKIVQSSGRITSALDSRLINRNQIDAVAEECHGIPLLLTVYAKYLVDNGDNPAIYNEIIAALRKVNFKERTDLTKTLMYAFRKLSPEAQDAFVDICIYFHGWRDDDISFIVGTMELEALKQAAFINIDSSHEVVVHDVLRALGIQEGRENRIQNLHDFKTIKKLDKAKGMWLLDGETSDTNEQSFSLEDHHLTAMNDSLRVLALGRQTRLISACDLSFPELRFLQVEDLDELPILHRMHGLKYIKIMMRDDIEPASSLKLWQNMKNLGNLEKFAFHSSKLQKLPPDFRLAATLRDLDLSECRELASLPSGFGNLCCLQSLELRYCESLEALPNDFGNLSALKSLDLESCGRLETLSNDFGNLSALQSLDLTGCEKLKSLSSGFSNLRSLQSLTLMYCESLEALPNDFGNLSALQSLDLEGCKSLKSLPSGFGNLCSLQSLQLWYCVSLEALPNDFGNLRALQSLNLEGCKSLEALPNDFDNLSTLESLNLRKCERLKSFLDGFHSLNSLQELYF